MDRSESRALFQTLAAYNRWSNEALYTACAIIPDHERKADCGVYYRSIHGTLNHLLYGDRAWMGRFTGVPFAPTEARTELYADFETLWQERRRTDNEIVEWVDTLTPQWLNAPFSYRSNIDQITRVLPTATLVLHLFNHQTHHRGQLTTLLAQKGYDYPVIDLPWMSTV